jgi:hypothetical protein
MKKYILLMVICLILICCGCENTVDNPNSNLNRNSINELENSQGITEGTKEQNEGLQLSKIKTKKYKSPFLEYEYPASWNDSSNLLEGHDSSIIKIISDKGCDDNRFVIKMQYDFNYPTTLEEMRSMYIDYLPDFKNIEFIDTNKTINNNIGVIESIVYDRKELHTIDHFWTDGEKRYIITFTCLEDDWNNNPDMKEIIRAFQDSLIINK